MGLSQQTFNCGQDCSDCTIGKSKIPKRVLEWLEYSEAVRKHIEDYAIPQYGDKPDDQVEAWTAVQCVRQTGKYMARFESNIRGEQERIRDLFKSSHYECLAWHKLKQENNG